MEREEIAQNLVQPLRPGGFAVGSALVQVVIQVFALHVTVREQGIARLLRQDHAVVAGAAHALGTAIEPESHVARRTGAEAFDGFKRTGLIAGVRVGDPERRGHDGVAAGKFWLFPGDAGREEAAHGRATSSPVFSTGQHAVVLPHVRVYVIPVVGEGLGGLAMGGHGRNGATEADAPALRLVGNVIWQIFQHPFFFTIANAHDDAGLHLAALDQAGGNFVRAPGASIAVPHVSLEAVLTVVHVEDGIVAVGLFGVSRRRVNVQRTRR